MRDRGWTDIIVNLALGLLTFVLLAVIVLIFVAVAYPRAVRVATAEVRRSLELVLGADLEDQVTNGIKLMRIRAGEGYEYRLKPSARLLLTPLDRYRAGKRLEEHADERVERAEACLECHSDVFESTALDHLYYDHKLHHEQEVFCDSCHRGSALRLVTESETRHAGEPPSPSEKSCIDCHEKKKIELDCTGCHPPGSVFAGPVYAQADAERFTTDKVRIKWFKGFEVGKSDACASCHERERFCVTCHDVEHPPSWRQEHGNRLLRREKLPAGESSKFFGNKNQVAMVDCIKCHRTNWCAELCHRNPDTAPVSPRHPVPIYPLNP